MTGSRPLKKENEMSARERRGRERREERREEREKREKEKKEREIPEPSKDFLPILILP
jgi:hypothetical protein